MAQQNTSIYLGEIGSAAGLATKGLFTVLPDKQASNMLSEFPSIFSVLGHFPLVTLSQEYISFLSVSY